MPLAPYVALVLILTLLSCSDTSPVAPSPLEPREAQTHRITSFTEFFNWDPGNGRFVRFHYDAVGRLALVDGSLLDGAGVVGEQVYAVEFSYDGDSLGSARFVGMWGAVPDTSTARYHRHPGGALSHVDVMEPGGVTRRDSVALDAFGRIRRRYWSDGVTEYRYCRVNGYETLDICGRVDDRSDDTDHRATFSFDRTVRNPLPFELPFIATVPIGIWVTPHGSSHIATAQELRFRNAGGASRQRTLVVPGPGGYPASLVAEVLDPGATRWVTLNTLTFTYEPVPAAGSLRRE